MSTAIQRINRALLGTLMNTETASIVADRLEELEREKSALLDENVRANGLLGMAMKREAKLREALDRALTAINAGFGKAQRDHIITEGRKLLA